MFIARNNPAHLLYTDVISSNRILAKSPKYGKSSNHSGERAIPLKRDRGCIITSVGILSHC